MTKISFNPKAFNVTGVPHGDVRHAERNCAFEPIVVGGAGVEAIWEGLRLAHVKGFELSGQKRVIDGPAE